MSADDDRLMYSGDARHARDRLAYGGLDALLGGPVAALPNGRSRHGDARVSTPPVVLTSNFAAPHESEITTKLPPVSGRPISGSSSAGSWILEQPIPAAAPGEARAIDNLSRVGVRSSVKMQPRRGWRRAVYVTTRLNLGLSRDELYELDLYARVRRTARESHQIGVFGLKGGVGKTAVTVALGSVLAAVRGDRILAIDADPASGNLADRVGRQSAATVSDLIAAKDLSRYNDVRAFTSMNESKLEVLGSDEYSGASRAFNDADWNAATSTISKHYNLVLADCAADMFSPAGRGVLSTVSGAVIVASASIDGARQAAVTMDWLRHNGYQDLLNRSCVVINHVGPGKPNVNTGDLVHQFQKHVAPGRVFVLPWDKHIAAGTEIHFDLLRPRFRRRALELAAALSDDFEGGAALA
ncbi:MinD/ParA family ATP-binding protein [Mycolicibacterium porcinum]|uniref:MinD/ParA family protein n=1 Tax=Mycolicibacterium porcinum TaxID=39693 RepID=A0AAW5T3I5_9MYCO|nr:MinD/ParA family protein [Mycolicibacterium porcinum]MCV7389969.1 MinD/ParA family protein [Mycolicibacterium porcinum]ORB38203.1 ATPase [Mycolicibacterium porcinum]CDO30492.1 chromosome partitioning ATPase [Mycolicibacterium vulneris]